MLKLVSTLMLALPLLAASGPPPVRGLHIAAPHSNEMDLAERFIREALPKLGVNRLVVEINYGFAYQSHPEVAEPGGLTKDDLKRLTEAARAVGVELIPMINCLGHQSWAKSTGALLRAHPEFDETPGRAPQNEGIYCRSWCPLHPKIHEFVFDLMDELLDATGAHTFHTGMDEVFLLGEDECPRCKGRNKAELFAGEVKALHDHLAAKGAEMWMWGDRFLEGSTTGFGKWEASANGTEDALRMVPKDIVISDWHYERALPTASYFAINGFRVVSCPWRKPSVALGQLQQVRDVRAHATAPVADRMLGMMETTWVGFGQLARAWFGEKGDAQAAEVVLTMRELFAEMRAQ